MSDTPSIEDLKAQIESLITEKTTLAENNSKLVKEKRDALSKAEQAEAAAEAAKDEASTAAGDELSQLKRQVAKLERDNAALAGERDTLSGNLRTIRIDNEISRALDENKVLDHMKTVLASHYKLMAKYEDGQGNIDGAPIATFIKTHLASNEGAHYRKASDNTGGNANDSTNTIANPKLTKRPTTQAEWEYLDSLPDAERNTLCDQIGEPGLKV